jgi:ubiquinone/menaquinone biosynthesis C-methylase UbiE
VRRDDTPERMDEPDIPRAELEHAFIFIKRVNQHLGGTRALTHQLERWSARWPADRPITLLDVGAGCADIPIAACRWADCKGLKLACTAVDLHDTTLDIARDEVARAGLDDRITVVKADALKLTDTFEPGSFDYAHAGMFLHHLNFFDTMTVLRIMERLASAGIVWNDLLRSRLALVGIHLLTVGAPEMVKHDARVSVRKGFTPSEVKDVQNRLELRWCRLSTIPWQGRFVLAGEKPDAWSGLGRTVD